MDVLSHEQFSELVMQYKDNLFRTARCILKNSHDAEDAVCEAIYRAFRSLRTLKDTGAFRPWIYRITINEAYQIVRRRWNVASIDDIGEIGDAGAEEPGEPSQLSAYVNSLPDHMRIPVYLFYYEDMRIMDIARILGLPAGTVKSRLARAREQLREIILKEEVQHGF